MFIFGRFKHEHNLEQINEKNQSSNNIRCSNLNSQPLTQEFPSITISPGTIPIKIISNTKLHESGFESF